MAREAKSLTTLRTQLNAMFPQRDKKSDGGIGDARHQKSKSDHNPNSKGVYRARDFTHNVTQGIDCRLLLAALLASKDSRIKYIIFDSFIYNERYAFAKRPYTGANAHKSHLHISVKDDEKFYDDGRAWELQFGQPTSSQNPMTSVKADSSPINLKKGDKDATTNGKVTQLQTVLHYKGFLRSSDIDGFFGDITEKAVRSFQSEFNLRVDGIVGNNSAQKLGL